MTNKLKLRLAALAVSATTLLNSGCEICSNGCTSFRRASPAQGCYEPSCQGFYQAPSQPQCYAPSVCGPVTTLTK